MKSDMESECDDVFVDDSPKDSASDVDGCQIVNRKRRRGIIEKRRRDRINSSLSELKRLVPAAFEKQGSAKLEKAEILQMAVEHLKGLHIKGMDLFSFEPKFIMDYHGIGFRECASEVARYLVGIEGMDLQDPVRMRLMSHLQCFAAQRELALKSSGAHNTWNPSVFAPIPPTSATTPQYRSVVPPVIGSQQLQSDGVSALTTSSPYSYQEPKMTSPDLPPNTRHSVGTHGVTPTTVPSVVGNTGSENGGNNNTSTMVHSLIQMASGQYIGNHGYSNYNSSGPAQPSPVKPYRPWGTELAY